MITPDADGYELVKAARELAPELAARADGAEELGRLPDATIEDLENAGLTRMTAPRNYGGHQVPVATALQVLEELGRGCGSTAFVGCVYASTAWMTCLLPDETQKEVFESPNPKAIAAINPMTAAASRQDGGYVLSGRWPFCSGQHHAGWTLNFALTAGADDIPDVGMFLVPRSEVDCADDWQVAGMAATGSNTLMLQETFVPASRVVLLRDLMEGRLTSTLVAEDPYYQAPLLPFIGALAGGAPLGMAREALEMFTERISGRAITYTPYLRQADAAVTHLQMAEARMKLDEAWFHANRLALTAGLPTDDVDLVTRARCRADMAWVVRLCREVVDIIESASGGQAIHRKDRLQRIVRDVHAISVHSLLLATTNAELYGRILCGLDPGTPMI